jgi:DNA mismatch endonuclease (patch repair protein)
VDIAFPGARLAVFVDGCFWHGCPAHWVQPKANAEWWRIKERDGATDRALHELGWRVLRFWEHEPPTTAVEQIEQLLAADR